MNENNQESVNKSFIFYEIQGGLIKTLLKLGVPLTKVTHKVTTRCFFLREFLISDPKNPNVKWQQTLTRDALLIRKL